MLDQRTDKGEFQTMLVNMKKTIAVAALCTSFSAANAQEMSNISTKKPEAEETHASAKKSFDISIGYTISTMGYNNDKDGGRGIFASAGKIFNLEEGFSTTTNLTGSVISFDMKYRNSENDKLKTYEIGLSQRFSYNIESGGAVFRPFLEAGYSRGRRDENFYYNQISFSGSREYDIDYNKFGVAVGAQLALSNGLTPFIKYDISKIKLESTKLTSNINGQSSTEEFTLGSNSPLDFTALTVGLGYLF